MRKYCLFMIGLFASMFLLAGNCVSAEKNYVFDFADLLTLDEEMLLQRRAVSMNDIWELNFLVVTTDDTSGKDSAEYADDFYDYCFPDTDGEDGILYLINMDEREIYLSTSGNGIRYLTDDRIEKILDQAYNEISSGNYYETFVSFFDETEYFLNQGILDDQYSSDDTLDLNNGYQNEKKKSITILELLIAALAALGAAAGTGFFIKGKYQLKFEDFHYDAYTDSEVKLSVKEDVLVNSFVTHHRIPRNHGSNTKSGGGISKSLSGRSSIHRGSSGRSHGGGGRKF